MNKQQLEQILRRNIISVQNLSGGDIAVAQKVVTETRTYFVKSGQFEHAKELFEKEVVGLSVLEASKSINIPKIIGTYTIDDTSCLILDFIETKSPEPEDMETFGRQLALMHQSSKSNRFGFEEDNLIGKLPQSNRQHSNWASFYVLQRLQPQIELAIEQKLLNSSETKSPERLLQRCNELFGDISPSLLHGDLWSGNYLIDISGNAYLIDPAVYYGHNEVDLAMTKLFGGFSKRFYEAYHEIIPPHIKPKELTEIYQLYYLLVHLNLFGTSYKSSVVQILKKYFN